MNKRKELQDHFFYLRKNYPVFTFYDFSYSINKSEISFRFDFRIGNKLRFTPGMTLKLGKYALSDLHPEEIRGLIFHIGMIEMVSYWKAVCSPVIHIRGYRLTKAQQSFWKKLYYKGLGEFFYQNTIMVSEKDFMDFSFDETALPIDTFHYRFVAESDRILVPVGGGKDSVVTLEHLKKEKEVVPFIINPRGATLDCVRIAGFPREEEMVILNREIDPVLLELNEKGYLNGHTPFSAMLAFHSLLASYGTGIRDIALSNESSANEPTIPGTEINHQYSKSLEFEEDFRSYVTQFMQDVSHYYSYLRPYSELQIAEMFSRYPDYFPVFRSCNVGSKQNIWCGNCPKCLFTAIILAPFLEPKKIYDIFGEDILDKPSLQHYFDELTGIATVKPFECVGTVDEVNEALRRSISRYKEQFLIQRYIKKLHD